MTTKTATRTSKTPEPVYDFDTWDEATEEAAIQSLVEEQRVKYIIVEGDFVGKFPDGDIVRVPLLINMDVIDQITGLEDKSVSDQLHDLLVVLGDQESADRIVTKTMAAIMSFTSNYFRAFERVNQATLGE